MIFDTDEIPESGLDFKLRMERDQFEIERPDCVLCEDVAVKGTLARVETDVYLRGEATTGLTLICSRCLAPVKYPVRCKVSAQFVPHVPSRKLVKEVELEETDLETEYYVENKIDIRRAVHDHILLAVPMVCLCKEECLGLCDRCGRDLNQGPCGCSPDRPVDPRLEILKSLKEKKT